MTLDERLRIAQHQNDLNAFLFHERKIAKLHTKCQNLNRARWIAQNPHREHSRLLPLSPVRYP